jgi:hypothetical protein
MAHSMVIPPPLDTLAKPYHPKGGLPHKLLLYGALPADKLTAYPNHQLDSLSAIQARLQGSQQQRPLYQHLRSFIFTQFRGPNETLIQIYPNLIVDRDQLLLTSNTERLHQRNRAPKHSNSNHISI